MRSPLRKVVAELTGHDLIEAPLGFRKSRQWRFACCRECIARSRPLMGTSNFVHYPDGVIAQRNVLRLLVLRSTARNEPRSFSSIEFRPIHSSDFLASLSRENQQSE